VREFFDLLDRDERSVGEIAARAGAHEVTICMWRGGHRSPQLSTFENMLEVMGYRLAIVPLSGMAHDTDDTSGQTECGASD